MCVLWDCLSCVFYVYFLISYVRAMLVRCNGERENESEFIMIVIGS
jgi:hypothetical protein